MGFFYLVHTINLVVESGNGNVPGGPVRALSNSTAFFRSYGGENGKQAERFIELGSC